MITGGASGDARSLLVNLKEVATGGSLSNFITVPRAVARGRKGPACCSPQRKCTFLAQIRR